METISIWPKRDKGEISFDELKRGDIVVVIYDGKISQPNHAGITIVADTSPDCSYLNNLRYAFIRNHGYNYYRAKSYREAYEEILKHCST
jgi:hypothetical protein